MGRFSAPGTPCLQNSCQAPLLAFRMLAVALERGVLVAVFAYLAAVLLTVRADTGTGGVRALLRFRHGSLPGHHSSRALAYAQRQYSSTVASDGYRLAASICSACFREVSVKFAPLSMRAISSTRSFGSICRTPVCVRPPRCAFSMRKC